MTTTFIFDVGGTLIEVDENRYGPLLTSKFLSKNLPKLECGEIPIDYFISGIAKETKLSKSSVIDHFNKPLTGEFIDGMKNVLFWAYLKHKAILLSNTNAIHWAYFSQYIYEYHHRILSFDVKCRKPDNLIYNIANNLVKSGKIVYFDDREENLEYPATLGWECYKFESAKHCWKIIEQF